MRKITARAKWLLPLAIFGISATTILISSFDKKGNRPPVIAKCCSNTGESHVCVMKTILGIDTSEESKMISTFLTSPMVDSALKKGMKWLVTAQAPDGGWGSGNHNAQHIRDPHAVETDPASTSLVGMSLLRTDNTPEKGEYAKALKRGTEYLLKTIENCPDHQLQITTLNNTQAQAKLGRNIDVILTAQFFTNLLRYELKDEELKKRVERALDKCIAKIQKTQSNNGAWQNGGWAPVLQSALANNALESAEEIGRTVDTNVLRKSRDYQKLNFNAETKSAVTGDAAGVMLYSITSSVRASAKEAQKAEVVVQKAKKEGKLKADAKVSEENLVALGYSTTESKNLSTAYSINKVAKDEAIKEEVMAGFGNNGGEEFLSFLMTGESMLMQGGDNFKKWYDMMSAKLVNIQNRDGSWNGHHCITSPVFCTATCLLILSIHNDMQFSLQLDKK